MNLTIDIGNSRIKCGVFENDQLIQVLKFETIEELVQLPDKLKNLPTAICSVRYTENDIRQALPFLIDPIFLNKETDLPFDLDYNTPQTLGMDRLAAAIGAHGLYPESDLLVIDLGTCITYDLVAKNAYQGGLIAPGIDLRYKSMNDYTANLPLLKSREFESLIGKSTAESMTSGVLNGITGEIEYYISQLLLKYPDLKVIMTGGDAELFESKINSDIFVALEIVLLGLNRVLKNNA